MPTDVWTQQCEIALQKAMSKPHLYLAGQLTLQSLLSDIQAGPQSVKGNVQRQGLETDKK